MAAKLEAPSKVKLIAELRALPEFVRYRAERRRLRQLPPGDGHPVMVFPGLAADDRLTTPLRDSIAALGYPVTGWQLGRNLGLRAGLLDKMLARLRGWHEQHGRKVSLVGWSLGGLYVRELAKREPDRVRQVITLGTPSVGDLHANNAWRLYELLNDHKVNEPPIETLLHECPPVPTTSIYSPGEGIVPPGAAMIPTGEQRENIAVDGSHLGLPWNPDAIRLVLDRLAQPEGDWRRYRR